MFCLLLHLLFSFPFLIYFMWFYWWWIIMQWQFLDFDAYPLESTRTLLLFCSMLCTTISPSCVIYVAGSNILSFYMDLITNIMHGLFGFCLIIYIYIYRSCLAAIWEPLVSLPFFVFLTKHFQEGLVFHSNFLFVFWPRVFFFFSLFFSLHLI